MIGTISKDLLGSKITIGSIACDCPTARVFSLVI